MVGVSSQFNNISGGERTIVKPIRLVDQVRDILREKILSRTLRPGDRLVEQKLARELGVGQNAVREALIELVHAGFVRRFPNKGTYVTKLTRVEAENISRVRTVLECLVIDLVAGRLDHDQLNFSQADESLAQMRACVERGDLVSFYEHDMQFHRSLWTLSDNPCLRQLLEQIVVPLFAFFIMLNLDRGNRTGSYREIVAYHERILDSLKRRSPEEARQAMRDFQPISLRHQKDILSEEHLE